jgi:AcrR family transcriptional regulator
MATQSQRRAATRDGLLHAAHELFQKRGFDRTAVEHITAAANVAKGTFYQHFASKTEILLALARRHQAATLAAIGRRLKQGYPPLKMGREMVRTLGQWCEEDRKILAPMMTLAMEKPAKKGDPSTRAIFARIFAEAQRQGEIRRDIDPYDLALMFVAGMVPAMIRWVYRGRKGELARWMEKAWRVFLEGAGRARKDRAT